MRILLPRVLPAGAALAAAALLAGCGKGAEGGAAGGGGGGFQFPPTAVETATVQAGPITSEFQTVGSIEAREAVDVVSEIAATVVALPFREGDPIRKGALIAQLDDSELAADLARAEALRDQTRSSFERVRTVVDKGAGSKQNLDDAAAALKVAEANVDLARARLAKTQIVAPFSGVIGAREVSPGAYLSVGEVITHLAQVAELDIVFSVPERHAAELHRGAKVTVSTAAFPGHEVIGTMDVVDPILDPATRSVHVIARASNPEGLFRPGMSADVDVVLAHKDRTLTIPSEAIVPQGNEFLVYKVQDDGTVAPAPVQLGARTPSSVEILSGLAEGDVVVRAGQQKLHPGAKVVAVNAPPAGGAGELPPGQNESVDLGAPPAGAAAESSSAEATP